MERIYTHNKRMVDECEMVKKWGRISLVVKNRGATGGETLEKQNAYHSFIINYASTASTPLPIVQPPA